MTYPVGTKFAKTKIPTIKGYVMSKNTVVTLKKPGDISEDPLTELLRSGARQLIAEAVEAELHEFLSQYEELQNQHGNRLVIRNGYLPEREILTGIGTVSVRASSLTQLCCHPIYGKQKALKKYCPGCISKAFPVETSRKHFRHF
jgi:hypothetical protein